MIKFKKMSKQTKQLVTHFGLADTFSFGESGRLERDHRAMKVIDKSNASDMIWSKKMYQQLDSQKDVDY